VKQKFSNGPPDGAVMALSIDKRNAPLGPCQAELWRAVELVDCRSGRSFTDVQKHCLACHICEQTRLASISPTTDGMNKLDHSKLAAEQLITEPHIFEIVDADLNE
jgi:hypothetical protein